MLMGLRGRGREDAGLEVFESLAIIESKFGFLPGLEKGPNPKHPGLAESAGRLISGDTARSLRRMRV